MSATITTINPTTGATLATYDSWNAAQIESAVAHGHQTALAWGEQPLSQRVAAVQRVADQLRNHKSELAKIMTLEMGKPLREAEGEVEKSAVTAEYYVKNAERLLGDEAVQIDGVDAWVSYEPIGLVLAVMPWNFPLWQVMRFALPSLVAGNGVLLKHSPNVTGSALAIEKLLTDAGLPAGLLTTMIIAEQDVPNAIDKLIGDDRIAAVTLKRVEAGFAVPDICRELGISTATFYKWRAKYGGMDVSMMSRMKELEDENRRLKKMYLEEKLKAEIVAEALEKKW